MTLFDGDGGEMGKDHGIDADQADQLLSGRVPAGRDDLAPLASDLASLSAAYVREVDPIDARLWAARAVAQARLTPSDKGDLAATPASNADRPARQASGLPKRRTAVLESILAFLTTTAGKVVAAGALVAATTTGGLAATGNLPGQDDGPERVITQSVPVDDDTVDVADADTTELEDQAELDDQGEDCDAPDVAEADDDADEVEADDDHEVEAPEVESEDEHDATDDHADEPDDSSDDSGSESESD
jgi:hypothetical protein